jgi:cytochrome c biogenesis protein CcmG/thiol:disulfide interchange protein DsbE
MNVGPRPAGRRLNRRARSVLLAAALIVAVVVVALAVTDTGGAQPAPRRAPAAARPFSLAELGHPGQRVSLAPLAGQPVIVNFFASWCTPCQRETPLLARFYAEHHGRVKVIGVDSNDQAAAALRFIRAKRVGYPVGADPFPATTATSYGVLALPQTFFLDAAHRIVAHVVGPVTARQLAAWAAARTSQAGR